jgi:predicted metal-dependent peptidase
MKRASSKATVLIERARRVLFALGWKGSPFFLIPQTKVKIRVADFISTACVDPRGLIYLNPGFCEKLSDDELKFVLAHELMHLLMLHFGRQGSRKPRRWNRGGDRAINYALTTIGLVAPESALLPLLPAHQNYTAEEFCEVEPEQQNDSQPYAMADAPLPCAGCGPMKGSGDSEDELPGEGEAPGNGHLPSNNEAARIWRQIAASSQAIVRSAQASGAGTNTGILLARLLDVPPSRVKWAQLLRGACARAQAQAGRDDSSWSRRNRRSFGGPFILPGPISYSVAVAAAVDTSGSVPERSIAQAVTEVQKIVETSNVPIYLVVHDAEVQWQGWVKPGTRRTQIENVMTGRGGTLFTPAYAAVENAGARFDALVHLTDGMPCEPWPEKPSNVRKPIVALIGAASLTAIPANFKVVEAEI